MLTIAVRPVSKPPEVKPAARPELKVIDSRPAAIGYRGQWLVVTPSRIRNDPTLRETVGRLAPGTALRDGLERILRGRTGALIVLGYDDSVEGICDGGFALDVRYAPDPTAGAVEDGRRRRAVHRRRADRAGQRATGAGPVHTDRRVRHPASFGRTHRRPDRIPGDLGEPFDEHRDRLCRRRASRGRRFGHHPVAGQPGDRHPRALQDPARRSQQAAVHRRDRGLRHAARRDDRRAATRDGPPYRPGDRLRHRRVGHRRPSATSAARGAAGRQRHRPRTDRPRLPRHIPSAPSQAEVAATLEHAGRAVGRRTARLHRTGAGVRLSVDASRPRTRR